MAKKPCKYQLPGQDTWMSEAEFKKALNDGLLDKFFIESGISIPALRGFKPESARAESYNLKGSKFGKMGQSPELKSSGFNPNDNLFSKPELAQNTSFGWRTMGTDEFNSLASGEKKYEGGAPKGGNWISGIPESSSKFGGEGKVMVEFGGIDIKGGENMSAGSSADRNNVTKVWKYNSDTKQFEEAPELLDSIKNGSKLEAESVSSTEKEMSSVQNQLDDIYDNKIPDLEERLKKTKDEYGMFANGHSLESIDKQRELLKSEGIELNDYLSDEQKSIIGEMESLQNEADKLEDRISDLDELDDAEKSKSVASEKERFGQKLSNSELDALRTSIRNKFPDSYTSEVLDQVSEAIKTGESNLPFELDYLADGITLNDVAGILAQDELFDSAKEAKDFLRDRAISGDLLNAKREAVEEGKKSRSYEALAEKIRNGKIDTKGMAMSSLPGFTEAWNASVEAAAKAVEAAGATVDAVQKGIAAAQAAFKKTDFYKSLKDRAEKKRYMDDLTRGIETSLNEEKLTGKQKKAGKEFKGKVDEATGVTRDNKIISMKEMDALKQKLRTEAKSSKDAVKYVQGIKEEIKKFIKDTLPKEQYSRTEVNYLINAVNRAKNEATLDRAIDKVSELVQRKNEQIRKKKVKEVIGKIKNSKTLYSKVDGKKKGKVTVEAQKEFYDFVGTLSDIESMSMEELNEVSDIIDGIVETGKADLKNLKKIQDDIKMKNAADMLEELAGEPDAILSDNEAVSTFFEGQGGYVIIDGKMYNKSSYNSSPYNKNVDPEPIPGPAKGYTKVNMSEKKRIISEKKGRATRLKESIKRSGILDNIYGYFQVIGKGAPKTAKFIKENISQPIKDYFVDVENSFKEKADRYFEGVNEIFGSKDAAQKRLTADADINPLRESRKQGVPVSNSVLVSLYNMSRLENGMSRLEKSGVDAQDLVDYIESNQDLKDYANFLVEQYESFKSDYEPTFIAVNNMPFPEGYYYPAYADANFDDDTFSEGDIFDADNNFLALNAMTNNLKQKTGYQGAFNTSMGAEEIFFDYIKNMERAKYLIPVAKAANQLFAQQNRPYILDKMTAQDLSDLQTQLGIILTGKRPIKKRSEEVMDQFMNYNSLTTLGFKLKSLPTQLVSFTNFWGQGIEDGISPKQIIKAFPKTKAEWEFYKDVFFSEYLKERRTGKNLDLELKRLFDESKKGNSSKWWAKVSRVAMAVAGNADFLANVSPLGGGGSYAIARYRDALAQGMSEAEAKDYAFKKFVEGVEETQQTSREDYVSSFQRATVGRMFSSYKSSQIGGARKIVKGFRTLTNESSTDKQKVQAYYDIVYYSIFSSILFNLISNAGYAVFKKDDDEQEFDEETRVGYDLFVDQVQSTLQGFGVPGFIVDGIINAARGDEWKNNVPLTQFFNTIMNTGGAVIEALSKDDWNKDIDTKERERFLEEIGDEKNLTYSQEEYLKLMELYENASIWRKMTPKQRKDALKVLGVKNLVKQAEDFAEYYKGNKSFLDAFMGYEKDYFEYAKARNKKDYIFKIWFGEDYIPKETPGNKKPTYEPEMKEDLKSTETEENW
jgi:hypothetical protein